jgi:cyclic pyranopterin phosphate synthase
MRNIEAASLRGFQIKLNVVTMKGINDHEIFDFIEFAKKYQLEVRFLELMRIGFACQNQEDLFISTSEIKSKIQERYSLKPVFTNIDSTSQNFVTDHGATIGFISSESQPFCGHCSRWRLTAEGMLKSCLLKNEGITLKNKSKIERMNAYKNSLNLKPYLRPPEVLHDMNTIGG